jgi:hypothetical protein
MTVRRAPVKSWLGVLEYVLPRSVRSDAPKARVSGRDDSLLERDGEFRF